MIKTGDWSIVDLIKYLVAVQSTLTSDELGRLSLTAAFPKESKDTTLTKVPRAKAGDLYEPLDIFRELGLPVLDWGGKSWKPSSEEGKIDFMSMASSNHSYAASAKFLFRLEIGRAHV